MVLWRLPGLRVVVVQRRESRLLAGCSCPVLTDALRPASSARPAVSAGRRGAAYITVFALTVLVGARRWSPWCVATATRRRRAHHRMVVDPSGSDTMARLFSHVRVSPRPGLDVARVFSCLLSARCGSRGCGQRPRCRRAEVARSLPMSGPIYAPATILSWRRLPRTRLSRAGPRPR